jgi:hypothetical protein
MSKSYFLSTMHFTDFLLFNWQIWIFSTNSFQLFFFSLRTIPENKTFWALTPIVLFKKDALNPCPSSQIAVWWKDKSFFYSNRTFFLCRVYTYLVICIKKSDSIVITIFYMLFTTHKSTKMDIKNIFYS